MKIWNDEEVLSLFSAVEKCKSETKSLKFAFETHAEKYKRRPNSVRNYYYHEVENLKVDESRCSRLSVDLNKHIKNTFDSFDKIAEEGLFEKIKEMIAKGESVRAACLKLSNGDLQLMTRYQNKYQNMKRKLEQSNTQNNIIPFKQKQKILTDNDINSLFLGLVKLIKKNTLEDFLQKSKEEKKLTERLLQNAYIELSVRNKELTKLKEEFVNLKNENRAMLEKMNSIEKSKNEKLKHCLLKNKQSATLEEKRV